MPDFANLRNKAKDLIDKRGGVDALKADAEQLKKIATGEGTLKEKANAAAAAIKEPGRSDEDAATTPAASTAPPEAPASPPPPPA